MRQIKSLCKFLIVYCSISATLVNAVVAQKFSIGVKGGVSATWAHFGEHDEKSRFSSGAKFGYSGGILFGFPVAEKQKISFFAEGGYSKKGRVVNSQQDTWRNVATYNMIDLSMCVRKAFTFHLKENLPVDAFFNIGPEVNYILNGSGYIQVGGPKYAYKIIYNPTDSTKDWYHMDYFNANRWLFGLGIGGGMKFPIRKGQYVIAELRFISGHTYLGKRGNGLAAAEQGYSYINILTFEDTLKTNLKTFSFTLAYVFDFDIQKSRMGKSTLDKKIKRKR